MGFLESVGIFAILVVIVLLLLVHQSRKESGIVKVDNINTHAKNPKVFQETIQVDLINAEIKEIKERITDNYGDLPEEVNYRDLIRFSNKCQIEINKYNKASNEGIHNTPRYPLEKKLKNILKEPLEFWTAMEGYYKNQEWKDQRQKLEDKRDELYIKYKEIVFGIFDINSYLSRHEIIQEIQSIYRINSNAAEDLFNQWNKYNLISHVKNDNIPFKNEVYEIYFLLSDGDFRPEFRLSRYEWLKENNKTLVDNSSYYIINQQ